MNQVPIVPINPCMVQQKPQYVAAPQACVQPQQPNYNAVKIDIHNPTVGTPVDPTYNYPQAPIYNYPTGPVVCYPPVVDQPQAVPPVQAPEVQQPVNTTAPVQPQAPVQVEPQVQVPPPSVIGQQNINYPAPATEPVKVDEPAQKEPATAAEVQKPEVVPAQEVTPKVDLNEFIAKLANSDFDVQAKAMEDIAAMVKEHPEQATELVDAKVFESLNNIINADTSKLEGPTPEQNAAREKIIAGNKDITEDEKNLANVITPKELAERNKSYALYTTAIMDKLYADEVAKLNNTVSLTELPGMVTVVEQLKDNPNPMVRASAIEALSYVQSPEYKKDLTTLFTVAQNDQDQGVAQAAKAALDKLNQI